MRARRLARAADVQCTHSQAGLGDRPAGSPPDRPTVARLALCIALASGLVLPPAAAGAGFAGEELPSKLARGKLLVASETLLDPNFAETVVLLLEYEPAGALGVVVNRPTDVKLAAVFPMLEELKGRPETIHLGGPVAMGSMVVLARAASPPEGGHQVFEDVYAIASIDTLRQMIGAARGKPGKAAMGPKFRAFAGYAGWGPGQLDGEVARGDWRVVRGDAAVIFERPPDDVWHDLVKRGAGRWVRGPGRGPGPPLAAGGDRLARGDTSRHREPRAATRAQAASTAP